LIAPLPPQGVRRLRRPLVGARAGCDGRRSDAASEPARCLASGTAPGLAPRRDPRLPGRIRCLPDRRDRSRPAPERSLLPSTASGGYQPDLPDPSYL